MRLLLSLLWLSVGPALGRPTQAPSDSTRSTTISSMPSEAEEYVVFLHTSAPHPEHVLSRINLQSTHTAVRHIYNNSAFRGFAVTIPPNDVESLMLMIDVHHVERAARITTSQATTPLPIYRANATWGLQRISSGGSYVGTDSNLLSYFYAYENPALGAGADIYIVDTGIDTDNFAFQGRATMEYSYDGNMTDGNGHGTHVSGTSASEIFGVASGANLFGVKVLGANGSGTTSDAIAGMDYVIHTHEARRSGSGFVGSVINLSWGLEGISLIINDAVAAAISQGIHVVIAAGNSGTNACDFTPAATGGNSSTGAITVGSIGITSAISSFSNTGSCVDLYAPGENVLSTWIGGDHEAQYLSGTSMATPHVTGVVAYLMAQNSELASSPSAMKKAIVSMAITGVMQSSDETTTIALLNNGVTASMQAPPVK